MTRMAVNGINLNVEVSGSGPAVTLLHGFTGSSSVWQPFQPRWTGYRLIRIDLIGHGASDAPEDMRRYAMDAAVTDLAEVLDALDVEKTALLGYSMGGRLALHFALAAQERLWALVLESASPGIEDEAERALRVESDTALADSIEADGLQTFVERWQAIPLFESQQRLPSDVLQRQRERRLSASPIGLANSLRGMGAGTQAYLTPRLKDLQLPVLLLAGELDMRYAALTRSMAPLINGSEFKIVPDAGHAVHLEQPYAYAELVRVFLDRHGPLEQKGND